MEKTVAKFRDFSEAEKADREFYRKLFPAGSAWIFFCN